MPFPHLKKIFYYLCHDCQTIKLSNYEKTKHTVDSFTIPMY